jgi:hypothetical protein
LPTKPAVTSARTLVHRTGNLGSTSDRVPRWLRHRGQPRAPTWQSPHSPRGPGGQPRISLADYETDARRRTGRLQEDLVCSRCLRRRSDRSRRIQKDRLMIVGMIKCLPIQDRMARRRHDMRLPKRRCPDLRCRLASPLLGPGPRHAVVLLVTSPGTTSRLDRPWRERGWGWWSRGDRARFPRPDEPAGGRHPGNQAGIPRNSPRTSRHRRSAGSGSVSLLSRLPGGAVLCCLVDSSHRDDVTVDARGFHDTEATSGPH